MFRINQQMDPCPVLQGDILSLLKGNYPKPLLGEYCGQKYSIIPKYSSTLLRAIVPSTFVSDTRY